MTLGTDPLPDRLTLVLADLTPTVTPSGRLKRRGTREGSREARPPPQQKGEQQHSIAWFNMGVKGSRVSGDPSSNEGPCVQSGVWR